MVLVNGNTLSIKDVYRVACLHEEVAVEDEREVELKVEASHQFMQTQIAQGERIYGVTTSFGGLATHQLGKDGIDHLQVRLLRSMKSGLGEPIRTVDVRAAMLIRANCLCRGTSGARFELIRRLLLFINKRYTPVVPSIGSIGASGDLIPLSYIASCIIGIDGNYVVERRGKRIPASEALNELGLNRLQLLPKEGLALINSTAMLTAVAANCLHEFENLLDLGLQINALMFQAVHASNLPLHPFPHNEKPHQGQGEIARKLRNALEGSQLIRDEISGAKNRSSGELFQDRYSIRCLPQYLGPVLEDAWQAEKRVEIEMNASSDNPLVSLQDQLIVDNGNFLGQHISMAMDQCRHGIAMVAKQLDIQIALLVEPVFSRGLPASLIIQGEKIGYLGLKPLQICGNSLVPLIEFYGQRVADRFAPYAEQYNQNLNSLGMTSSMLARHSIELLKQYLGIAMIFGVQAVELRCYIENSGRTACEQLSPRTQVLYRWVKRQVMEHNHQCEGVSIMDDTGQELDKWIANAYDHIQNSTDLITLVESIQMPSLVVHS